MKNQESTGPLGAASDSASNSEAEDDLWMRKSEINSRRDAGAVLDSASNSEAEEDFNRHEFEQNSGRDAGAKRDGIKQESKKDSGSHSQILIRSEQDGDRLERHQTNLIEAAILDLMYQIPEGGFVPCFKGYSLIDGEMFVNTRGIEDCNWLIEIVPSLSPWEGAKLTTDGKRKLRIGRMRIQGEKVSTETVLATLQRQNEWLDVTKMKVLHKKDLPNIMYLIVASDEETVKLVEERKCSLFFGLHDKKFPLKLRLER